METKILTEEKNPFLERSEITAIATAEASPSNNSIVESLGKDSELTVVKKIGSNFGKNTFHIEAVVYDSKESKENVETIPAKVKKKMEAEKKAAEEKSKAEADAAKKAEEEAKAAAEEANAASTEEKAEEVKEDEATVAAVPSEEGKEKTE